jgi:hypothetical protein
MSRVMVGPSVIAANIRRREPQRGHVRRSFPNTLIIRSAQLNFRPTLG